MGSNKESLRLASMPKILATLLVRNKIYHYLPSRWRSSKQCAVIFVWPASVSDPGNHIWSWFAAKFVVSTAIVLHKNADHWHQLMNDKHVQIWPGNQAGLALACPSVAASFVRWASKYFQILWSFKLQIPVGWFVWLLGLPGNAVGPCKALRETCADLAELTIGDNQSPQDDAMGGSLLGWGREPMNKPVPVWNKMNNFQQNCKIPIQNSLLAWVMLILKHRFDAVVNHR